MQHEEDLSASVSQWTNPGVAHGLGFGFRDRILRTRNRYNHISLRRSVFSNRFFINILAKFRRERSDLVVLSISPRCLSCCENYTDGGSIRFQESLLTNIPTENPGTYKYQFLTIHSMSLTYCRSYIRNSL